MTTMNREIVGEGMVSVSTSPSLRAGGAPAQPTQVKTPKTSINMHPKVFTGLLIGLAITVVTGTASVLSPDVFTALGPWEAPAFALATTGLSVLGAWLKGVKQKNDSGE